MATYRVDAGADGCRDLECGQMPESDRRTISGQFDELTPEQCADLLGTAVIGRVAYAGDHHTEILPVSFVYRDSAVLFRTAPYGSLAGLAMGMDGVAFEVDFHDDLNQSGWSVVVSGRVEPVEESTELIQLWSEVRVPGPRARARCSSGSSRPR